MPDNSGPFRVETSLGAVAFTADTLEDCKAYVCDHPELFPPDVRVMIRGPSVSDPMVDDRFPFTPTTPSRAFRKELVEALKSLGSKSGWLATPEDNKLVPGQTAAVWFTNNRAENPRRICIVRIGHGFQNVGVIEHHDSQRPVSSYGNFIPQQPPLQNARAVASFIISYLFDNAS